MFREIKFLGATDRCIVRINGGRRTGVVRCRKNVRFQVNENRFRRRNRSPSKLPNVVSDVVARTFVDYAVRGLATAHAGVVFPQPETTVFSACPPPHHSAVSQLFRRDIPNARRYGNLTRARRQKCRVKKPLDRCFNANLCVALIFGTVVVVARSN